LTCPVGCGAPLLNCDGKFVLKYFHVDGRGGLFAEDPSRFFEAASGHGKTRTALLVGLLGDLS